jgi:putative ABC transport system permease protein
LHLKLGDTLTVNVLGREVSATVTNFRSVDWQTLAINTVMVFSPETFRGAPFTHIATIAFPGGGTPAQELRLLNAIGAALPGVTTIRVKDAIAQINTLVEQIAWAVRGASAIALIASALVLGGAFAAGRRQRIHDAVVLKTLGATRRRLVGAFALEFLILGAATAVFALLAGAAAAWLVLSRIMDIGFVFLAVPAVGAAIVALAVTLALGLAGTWRALGQKAAPVLRNL